MATERFDAVVVGSGQGRNPLAGALAGAGMRTALIEGAEGLELIRGEASSTGPRTLEVRAAVFGRLD